MNTNDSVSQSKLSLTAALEGKLSTRPTYELQILTSTSYPEPPPLPQELIGSTLHFGRKMLLAAPSHGGKTSFMLALALAVAQGQPWLGLATTQSHVLYVNLEINADSFVRRVHNLAHSYGLAPAEKHFHFINYNGGNLDPQLFIAALKEKIIEAKLNGIEIKLVIIDPVYKLIGLGGHDQDSNRKVSELMGELNSLSILGDISVALTVEVPMENARYQITHEIHNGIGQLARDADTLLMLWPLQGHSHAFRLKGYLREFNSFTPKSLRFEFPVFEEDTELDGIPIADPALTGVVEPQEKTDRVDVWKIWDSFETKDAVSLEDFAQAMNLTAFEARQKIIQSEPHPQNPILRLRLSMGSKVKAEEDS